MEDGGAGPTGPLVRGPSLMEEMFKMLSEDPGSSRNSEASPQASGGAGGWDDRGASFMGQVQKALAKQEGMKGDEDEGGRRMARELDLKELQDLLHGGKAAEDSNRPRVRAGRGGGWEELDALLDTRATKVSAESMEDGDLVLWTGTWNVANKTPSGSLAPWLSSAKADGDIAPDLYFIGMQEVDTSMASAVMLVTRRGKEWLEFVHASMMKLSASTPPDQQYTKVLARQLGGVLMCCYCKSKHLNLITELSSGTASVGVMGMMGNKGAVGIRMKLGSRTLCVVAAHLNSGQESNAFERRRQDVSEINNKLFFFECSQRGSSQPLFFAPPLTIDTHETVIWLGDLNFRLQLSYTEATKLVKRRDFKLLMQLDELLRGMASRKMFHGFDEGVLDFPPTYKYDSGTSNYDTSGKQRTPSWTDRVLWKGRGMLLLEYTDISQMLLSDHRPVKAVLILRKRFQEGRRLSASDMQEHQQYHLEKQQQSVVESPQAPLLKWGSQGFLDLGESMRSSAEQSQEALQSVFTSVGMAFGQQLGLLDVSGIFPGRDGVPPLELSASGKWSPKLETVTPDNYRSIALGRLAVVLHVMRMDWIDAAFIKGVRIQASPMGGSSSAWLRGEVHVRHTIDALVPLLQDAVRREDWEDTCVDGATLQRYDESHSIQRIVRGYDTDSGLSCACPLGAQAHGAAHSRVKQEESATDRELWDFALLQSKHTIDGGGVVVLLQSVQHRLIPLNSKFRRSTLGFEAYALHQDGEGGTNLTLYLQIAADGTDVGKRLVALAEDVMLATSSLQSFLDQSSS